MIGLLEKAVIGMASLRLLSGMIEVTAALFMLKYNQVEKALLINSMLALVGPFILITTTAIGLVGIADRMPISKIVWILAGVGCILIGLRK